MSQKVVIGLTGRKDSAVAAFLLKKQGHQVIGVSLEVFDSEWDAEAKNNFTEKLESTQSKDFLIQAGLAQDAFNRAPVRPTCHIDNLMEVKAFCEWLGIPFYGVKASGLYQEKVMRPFAVARIQGRNFSPCLHCQSFKIQTLIEKAKLLGADFVATGHYAKIQHNHATNTYSVLSSLDKENDQSALLSSLKQSELSKLILPLAEIGKSEVEKLSKMIDVKFKPKKKEQTECFEKDPRSVFYLKTLVAPSLLKEGAFLDSLTEAPLGEHMGLEFFHWGKEKDKLSAFDSSYLNFVITDINYDSGVVSVSDPETLDYEYIYLEAVQWMQKMDYTKVHDVFYKTIDDKELSSATLYLKNNDSLILQLKNKREDFIPPGKKIILYIPYGKSARVIGLAEAHSIGKFYKGKLYLQRYESEEEEGEKKDLRKGPELTPRY